MGWIWEHVEGAVLEAQATTGLALEVQLEVTFPDSGLRLLYSDRAVAGADGVARLRVPYATDAPNGDGRVAPGAAWRVDGRSGPLRIPEAAVQSGSIVTLQ